MNYSIAFVAVSFVLFQSFDCSTDSERMTTVVEEQSIDQGNVPHAPYDFHHPDKIYQLPAILKEISGIALADARTVYCIQDEKGTVYKYDLHKNEISESIPFGASGDYEDIALVHDEIYVLRSDATIFMFKQKNSSKTLHHKLPVSCTDVEGFSFFAPDNILYLACKNSDKEGDGSIRTVYQFSPGDPAHPRPFLTIDQKHIRQILSEQSQTSGKGKFQFNPSGIAVHPRTGEVYILSATNQYLAVFRDTSVQRVYRLPADIYYQPEGIAFAKNGDLYLSNEGKQKGDGGGQIVYLAYK